MCVFQRLGCLLLCLVLHEREVLAYLHANQRTVRFEVPLQIASPDVNRVEVHHKQCLGRPLLGQATSGIFSPLDGAVTLLGPFNTQWSFLVPELNVVQVSNGVFSVAVIFHVNKCKACPSEEIHDVKVVKLCQAWLMHDHGVPKPLNMLPMD